MRQEEQISPDSQLLTAKLIERFKELLASGVLIPGRKLPPERDLALRFGVSRSSLRQALKILETMGILLQRVGQGTFLKSDAADTLNESFEFLVLVDGISIHELHEARIIVEPELAARAADRRSEEELAVLAKSLKLMEKAGRNIKKRIEQDLIFHRMIHHAAGNRICERMFAEVNKALIASISVTSQLVAVQSTVESHIPIFEAIESRRPKAAKLAMLHHLMATKRQLPLQGRTYVTHLNLDNYLPLPDKH